MDLKAERLAKHARLVDLLDRHGLDAALLWRRCNFSWYTCGARNYVGTAEDAGNSAVLVDRDGAVVIANNIETTRLAAEELPARGLEIVSYAWHDAADRARVFRDVIANRRLAADLPAAGLYSLGSPDTRVPLAACPPVLPGIPTGGQVASGTRSGVSVIPTGGQVASGTRAKESAGLTAAPLPPEFNRLRWSLMPSELQRYRAVCADVTDAVEGVARRARPGQTEDELAGLLAGELRARGCLPWVLLVGSDDRMRTHRHPLPTAKRVERYFMLATCAERGGLIAACSRLAHFGPVPDDLAARHRAVCTVDAALISATRPGTTLGAIFAEAQAAYAAAGFPDEWQRHHQGGSIGYLPREVRAGPGDATVALAGQAFAWNPTVAGTKCEDTILCGPGGGQLLAPSTDWPTIIAEWKGFAMKRPAILESAPRDDRGV
jgi:Xaa-Pro aminopeptidase